METVSFLSSLVKMVFALVLVLGLMIGSMYFIKKILHTTTPEMDRGSLIKILANRYLGPKNSILVIDVAGEIIAVGLSNSQMTMLTKISDRDALEKLRNAKMNGDLPSLPITQQLTRYKKKITSVVSELRK